MARKRAKRILINKRDMLIFEFLWRWKVATTTALAKTFFRAATTAVAYERLRLLKKAGHIQCQAFDCENSRFVWMLTDKGFHSLNNRLPELKDNGFGSESIEHDLYCSALHLGDWMVVQPPKVKWFSEQELRRFRFDHFPSWVPQTDLHRPDGYWYVPYKDKMITMAFEVEFHLKRSSFYDILAKFYDERPEIFRVVWLVSSRVTAKNIHQKLYGEIGSRCLKHDFICRGDFEKMGWQSPVCFGFEKGKTLSYVLGGNKLGASNSPVTSLVSYYLDTRKCPFDSRHCGRPGNVEQCNRLGILPSPHILPKHLQISPVQQENQYRLQGDNALNYGGINIKEGDCL